MTELVPPIAKPPRTSTAIALSVWKALFLRETLTRLSAERAAWLWLLLEPVAHVALIMILFSTIRQKAVPGADVAVFLAIGLLGFNLFRHVSLRSMHAISANQALFAYRQCKPVDAVIVRIFLEGVLQIMVAVVLLGGTALAGHDVLPYDPLRSFAAWMLLWLFGAGLGFMLSVGVTLIPEIGKVIDLVFFPLYFVSAVIFPASAAPPAVRTFLLYNPLVHAMEALRAPFFPGYIEVPGVNLGYLAAFALFSLLLGLALHIRYASKLVVL